MKALLSLTALIAALIIGVVLVFSFLAFFVGGGWAIVLIVALIILKL